MKRFTFFALLVFLVIISTVSADYTADFVPPGSTEYSPSNTITINVVVTASPQKGDPYTAEWYDSSDTLMETDNGFLSTTLNGDSFQTYTVPSVASWTNAYVNVTSAGTITQLFFNVTGNSSNSIVFVTPQFSPSAYIGENFAGNIGLETVDGKKLSNAICGLFGTDTENAPSQTCGQDLVSFDGRFTCDGLLSTIFTEGEEYLAVASCNCGSGINACFDEDGTEYENFAGTTSYPFTVSKWLDSVNTITDKSSYTLNDEYVTVCVNVTNLGTERIPLDIIYNWRCGSGDSETDRVVIDDHEELRGISANTTQNQCAELKIKNIKAVAGKTNTCYAATEIHILDKLDNKIFTYSTTSPSFTFTSESTVLEDETMQAGLLTLAIIFGIIIFALLYLATQMSDEHALLKLFLYIAVIFLLIAGAGIGITASGIGFTLYNAVRWLVVIIVIYIIVYLMYSYHQQANDVVPK